MKQQHKKMKAVEVRPMKRKQSNPPIIRWLASRGLLVINAVACSSPLADVIQQAIEDGKVTFEGSWATGRYLNGVTVLRRTSRDSLPEMLENAAQRRLPYLRRPHVTKFLRKQYAEVPKIELV
jgi:hypothetical protein